MEVFINYLDLFGAVTNAIAVSFVLEALKKMFPKITTKKFLPIVSLIFTALYIPLSDYRMDNFQTLAIQYLFTTSFSVLYYLYLGKVTVDKLLNFASQGIDRSAEETTSKPIERCKDE